MAKRNEVEVIITADDNASKNIKGIMGTLGDFGLAIDGIKAGIGIVQDLSGGLIDMATNASKLEGVEEAFNGISKAAGKSADEVLASFKKFSAGTISQADAMKSYNTAAQLVGNDFANTLPEAMKYLSKISSATGEDVGFMLDSMVKGVGRLSPMILDNLGIQVNMTEATEAYAKSIGKSADELTKAEQQTALMNQVMEKLAENTAAMPDVAGQVDTKMAAVGATFEDIKYKAGKFLIPVLEKGVEILSGFVNIVDLLISGDFKGGIFGLHEDDPFINVLFAIRDVISTIASGGNPLQALGKGFDQVIQGFRNFGQVGIADFLTGIRNVLLGQVIPAIQGFIAFIQDAWENKVLPVLQSLADWFLNELLPAVVKVIQDNVMPIIESFFKFLGDAWAIIGPALENLYNWFVTEALPAILNFITTTVIPTIGNLITFLGNIWNAVAPFLLSLLDWFINTGLPAIVNFVTTTVVPFVQNFISLLQQIWTAVGPVIQGLVDWFVTTGWPIIQAIFDTVIIPAVTGFIGLLEGIWTTVQPALDAFKTGISAVFTWINDNVIQPIITAIQGVINLINSLKGTAGQTLSGAITGGSAGIGMAQNLTRNLIAQYAPQANTFGRDNGGPGSAGNLYKIGVPEVYNTPDGSFMFRPASDGQFNPMQGGETTININFMGPAPTSQQEADNAGYMIVNSMQARGVKL